MYKSVFTVSGALAVLGALVLAPAAGADGAGTYRVTITNLTAGQPFTPPVVATHRGKDQIFEVGSPASAGVQQIAENGNNAPLLAALGENRRVSDFVQAGSTPLVPAGRVAATGFSDHVTFDITADRGANRISFAMMLICTNDGFTGVNSLKLPKHDGDAVTVRTNGYDAGTELNTQRFVDMVPPCHPLVVGGPMGGTGMTNPALAEGDVIHHHAGILQGVGDLDPAVYGWTDPVAEVTVTAIG